MKWITFFFLLFAVIATVDATTYPDVISQLVEFQSGSELHLEPSFSAAESKVKGVRFQSSDTHNYVWVIVFTPAQRTHTTILSFEVIGGGYYPLPEFEVWQQHSRVLVIAVASDKVLTRNMNTLFWLPIRDENTETKEGEYGISFFSYVFRGETAAIDTLIEKGFSLDGIKNIVFCPYKETVRFASGRVSMFTPKLLIIEEVEGTEIQYVRKGIGDTPKAGLESVISSALFQAQE